MPGQQLHTSGFVLAREPAAADSFERLVLFSTDHGVMHVLVRIPKSPSASKSPRAPRRAESRLDLFDEAEAWLESSNQGRTWFVREHRIEQRPDGLGRSYEALRRASGLASLLLKNPVPDESREQVAALLRQTFAALAAHARADIIWLKALYCFLRDEGYPVKQQWWQGLPKPERQAAASLLNQPLAGLPAGAAAEPAVVAALIRRLEEWLRTETELKL